MLPDESNESYTVLFLSSRHSILPISMFLTTDGRSARCHRINYKVLRETQRNQCRDQSTRETENANKNMFVIKSGSLFSKPETRFSPIEMPEKRGKCRIALVFTIVSC